MESARDDSNFPRLREIAHALEAWAPPGSAQSYDNVGLQVGDASRTVQAAVIALDLTPAVIDEAIRLKADLIVTHHPLLFRPLKQLTPASWQGALALRLAEAGIALYSIHTNLDAAPAGVSFALAETLGLIDVRFLEPLEESLFKLVTFVPVEQADRVRMALADAGAGRIGAYEGCAFASEGTGYFRASAEARPFIGTPGGTEESVREIRLEIEVTRWGLDRAVQALLASHPYEAVAYDVYPVRQPNSRAGMGAVGHLPEPEPLSAFLGRVADRLDAATLRYTGNLDARIETVAVCGGSGSDLTRQAIRAGADAFVTADVTYHKFFDVLDTAGRPYMALIDAGHYETEAMTERLLADWLGERFPRVTWHRTSVRTSPVASFVRA